MDLALFLFSSTDLLAHFARAGIMSVSSPTLAASVVVTCVVSIGRKLGGSNLLVLVDSGICAEWACAVIMVAHDVAESACPYPERFAVRAKFHALDGAWRLFGCCFRCLRPTLPPLCV